MAGTTDACDKIETSDMDGMPKAWAGLCLAGIATQKSIIASSNELYRFQDRLSVPDAVAEKAAYIYRKALENGLVRGRSASAVMAASMYAACREAGAVKTFYDVVIATNIRRKDVTKYYRMLVINLGLKVPIPSPAQYVPKVADLVGVSDDIRQYAIEILKKAEKHRFTAGKDPMALAATAIYISCNDHGKPKTQAEISEAAKIGTVVLRTQYRAIMDNMEQWISPKTQPGGS